MTCSAGFIVMTSDQLKSIGWFTKEWHRTWTNTKASQREVGMGEFLFPLHTEILSPSRLPRPWLTVTFHFSIRLPLIKSFWGRRASPRLNPNPAYACGAGCSKKGVSRRCKWDFFFFFAQSDAFIFKQIKTHNVVFTDLIHPPARDWQNQLHEKKYCLYFPV